MSGVLPPRLRYRPNKQLNTYPRCPKELINICLSIYEYLSTTFRNLWGWSGKKRKRKEKERKRKEKEGKGKKGKEKEGKGRKKCHFMPSADSRSPNI